MGDRLQLDAEDVDKKLWAGAYALGWRVVEAFRGSAARHQWRYFAPARTPATMPLSMTDSMIRPPVPVAAKTSTS